MPVIQNVRWQPPRAASAFELQSLAFNISTLGGRMSMSDKRGGNVAVAYRDGTLWTPKDYDERELELAMWVIGADPDTGEIPADPSDEFWTNVETLRRLFTTDDQMGELTYQHPTQAKDVTVFVEIRDSVDFETMAGATRAAFIVSMWAPGIWFRDPAPVGEGSYTSRAHNAQWTVTVDSDVIIKDPIIRFRAPGGGNPANMKLINESLSTSDNWVQFQDVLDPAEVIEIDVGRWRATLDGTTRVTGSVEWSGQPQFFWLLPGVNNLKLEVTSGPVDVQVLAQGAYW